MNRFELFLLVLSVIGTVVAFARTINYKKHSTDVKAQ